MKGHKAEGAAPGIATRRPLSVEGTGNAGRVSCVFMRPSGSGSDVQLHRATTVVGLDETIEDAEDLQVIAAARLRFQAAVDPGGKALGDSLVEQAGFVRFGVVDGERLQSNCSISAGENLLRTAEGGGVSVDDGASFTLDAQLSHIDAGIGGGDHDDTATVVESQFCRGRGLALPSGGRRAVHMAIDFDNWLVHHGNE